MKTLRTGSDLHGFTVEIHNDPKDPKIIIHGAQSSFVEVEGSHGQRFDIHVQPIGIGDPGRLADGSHLGDHDPEAGTLADRYLQEREEAGAYSGMCGSGYEYPPRIR